MNRFSIIAVAATVVAAHSSSATVILTEDFSSNPLTSPNWSFGVGDNSNSQFAWSAAPPAYTGDATGALGVHLNSSLPTARFQRPLGTTLTDTDSFTLQGRFSFHVNAASPFQFMQLAFGLVNSAQTGGDRTGSFADFTSDNVFQSVEFSYFPNLTFFGGPTLTPVVFGAQKGSGDAFSNFAAIYGANSDLGGNATGVTALPQDVTLEAVLNYDGVAKILTMTLKEVNIDGSLTLLNTEVPPLDLVAAGYDAGSPFSVDELAIMAYQDGFTTPADPSLDADLEFQYFQVTGPSPRASVPEPSSLVMMLLGLSALTVAGRCMKVSRLNGAA